MWVGKELYVTRGSSFSLSLSGFPIAEHDTPLLLIYHFSLAIITTPRIESDSLIDVRRSLDCSLLPLLGYILPSFADVPRRVMQPMEQRSSACRERVSILRAPSRLDHSVFEQIPNQPSDATDPDGSIRSFESGRWISSCLALKYCIK